MARTSGRASGAMAMAMADVGAHEDEKEIPVKVAVMIRPLVDRELEQGCRECLHVVPPGQQVRRTGKWAGKQSTTHTRAANVADGKEDAVEETC